MTYLNPIKSISEVVSVYKLYSAHLTGQYLIVLLSIINIKFWVLHYNNKKDSLPKDYLFPKSYLILIKCSFKRFFIS